MPESMLLETGKGSNIKALVLIVIIVVMVLIMNLAGGRGSAGCPRTYSRASRVAYKKETKSVVFRK